MQTKSTVLAILFSLVLVTVASGGPIDDMELNGTGEVFYMKFIKVYDAALYTSRPADEEEIIGAEVSMCLLLRYAVSVKKNDFIKAANTVLNRQYSRDVLEQVQEYTDLLHASYIDVKSGDNYTLCYEKQGNSTTLLHNEKELVRIYSKPFAEAYFGIWLGKESPLDDKLRDGLLSRN